MEKFSEIYGSSSSRWRHGTQDWERDLPHGEAQLVTLKGIDAQDPWSYSSVSSVERHFVARFDEVADVPEGLLEDLALYLGETARRVHDGQWVRLAEEMEDDDRFGVITGDPEEILIPEMLVQLAFVTSCGKVWGSIIYGIDADP